MKEAWEIHKQNQKVIVYVDMVRKSLKNSGDICIMETA
jgi:hypothetical protein